MMQEEPDDMVARTDATGKPVTDPPNEKSDVDPEFVEQNKGK